MLDTRLGQARHRTTQVQTSASIAATTELLACTALFGRLAPAELADIARMMRVARYQAGAAIFSRSDPGRSLYLVVEGQIRLSILSQQGREISFVQATRGAIFGEIAALDGGARTSDATAITKATLMSLDRAALATILNAYPAVAHGAIGVLCERLRVAAVQLETIALHSVEVRLARFLLARVRHAEPKRSAGRVTIDLGVSKGDLALMINVSRPKLSVAFGTLEGSKAIKRIGRAIECDIEALIAIVELD